MSLCDYAYKGKIEFNYSIKSLITVGVSHLELIILLCSLYFIYLRRALKPMPQTNILF